jgi:TRAP-type C4-dicarboxylate transport system permease small subunit
MNMVFDFNHKLARFGLWFGGALILLAAILIASDVLLRQFLNVSIGGSDELAHFALAIGTTWSLAGALIDRVHIRVDSAYGRFPLALKTALDFAAVILFVGFFAVIAWHSIGMLDQTWTSGTRSQSALQIPLIIPQALWFLGLLMFLLTGIVLLVKAATLASSGRLADVSHLIGTKSALEETDEEIEMANKVRAAEEPKS